MNQTKQPEMDTDKNKRLLNRYGILPKRGNLLSHQLEVRMTDFVLKTCQANSFGGREGNISTRETLLLTKLIGHLTLATSQQVRNIQSVRKYQSLLVRSPVQATSMITQPNRHQRDKEAQK